MKKIILFSSFIMLTIISLNSQPIDWGAVIDRYVEKYQPEMVPAWLFPIIFKDATGARDTIYFGYDEEATNTLHADTMFSEMYVPADSFEFNAFWSKCPSTLCDSLMIVDINIIKGIASYSINFRNGLLPVTMYFDATFLSDDVLPFPDQSPNPKAQINIKNGWPMSAWSDPGHTYPCHYHYHLLITDNSLQGDLCVYTDSIEFIADPDIVDFIGGFFFQLRPWTGFMPVSNKEVENRVAPKIYPNPARGSFTVKNRKDQQLYLEMYNLFGQRVKAVSFTGEVEINISGLQKGLYILSFRTISGEQSLVERLVVE